MKPATEWFRKAAKQMVQEGISLRLAAEAQGVTLTSQEADTLQRRKAFQELLWEERNKHWEELGSLPTRNKSGLVGKMEFCVQKLIEGASWDKALEGCLKIAKVEGYVGAESEVNVFGTLSQREMDQIRDKVKAIAPRVVQ